MNKEEKDGSKELEDLGVSVTKVNKKIPKVKRCYLSSGDSFFSSCLGFEEKGKEEKHIWQRCHVQRRRLAGCEQGMWERKFTPPRDKASVAKQTVKLVIYFILG